MQEGVLSLKGINFSQLLGLNVNKVSEKKWEKEAQAEVSQRSEES